MNPLLFNNVVCTCVNLLFATHCLRNTVSLDIGACFVNILGEVSECHLPLSAMDQTSSTLHPKAETQEAPAEPVSALLQWHITL